MSKIKIGIMGSGGYGQTARRSFGNTGEYEIVACHDTNPAAAQRAATEEGATAYTDAARFLSHPDMQAVSVNTPIPVHAEHVRSCLEHGKHVFVTKPVTASIAEARTVAELAQKRGLAVMVGHHARHRPAIQLIRSMLADGKLGQLCNVMVASCSSRGITGSPDEWRFHDRRNPGGPLLHCGVHLIDILLHILGPVRRVAAMCQDHITPHRVDDNYMVLLEFVNGGVQASLTSNYTTGYLHTMHWMGTDANLHLQEHITRLGQCDLLYQHRRDGACEPWEPLALPQNEAEYPDDHGGVLERAFAQQVRDGRPDYANLDQAIAVLQIVEAAVRSAKTGRFVNISPAEPTVSLVRQTLEGVRKIPTSAT